MNKLFFYTFAILASWGIGINYAYAATPVAPGITTQPANITVTAPATATFTVAASGTPKPNYQWMIEAPGAGTFTAINGATKASYKTAATAAADSGTQFECVVTNASGSVTSNAATLTVYVKPSITVQPVSLTVTAPATATLTVTSAGTPSPTYQWTQSINGGAYTNITGATGPSYTTGATTLADSGTKYKCVATNAAGSVTSTAATLTVYVVPSITTQPVNATVKQPAKASFAVAAGGTPALKYQWMQEAPGASVFTPITGATKSSYTTAATTLAENGTEYKCVVTNAAGSVTSNVVILTVYQTAVAPIITTQPVNETVTEPATATFTVSASGTPAPTYQWESEAQGQTSFTLISGATNASYTTPATTTADSGTQYECVVSNVAGSLASNAVTLTVASSLAVTITNPANNGTILAGSNVTITAVASETNGTISNVTFFYNGIQLATSTTFPYSYTWVSVPWVNDPGNDYVLTATATDANGISVTSSPVTITVIQIAPSITAQPVNATITAPATATFSVTATGAPAPTYQWWGELAGQTSFTPIPGATNATYTTPATADADNGTQYECVVSNPAGSVTSNIAALTVNLQPLPVVSITSPADDSTLIPGSNLTITASASEANGAISSVSFYNGTILIGTVINSPYTYTWGNVPAGAYNLTAVVTDTVGVTARSSVVSVITVTDPGFSFKIDGNLASVTDALGRTSAYHYDNLNRLTKISFADGSTVSAAYDLFGNLISVTDQRGNTLTKTYDPYERLAQIKDPNGGITQFNYDTEGKLLTLTDANGHPTTYTYDGDYRVLTQTNALNFTTAYAYDLAGNITTRTDANGKTTNYTYDPLNRLTNIACPDGTSVADTYDALGRRISMTDSTGQTSYTYDALSRLLSQTSPGANNTITYTYDSEANRLTSIDQNNRTITNTYDALNRLSTVTDPNGTTSYAYDAVSNELSASSPNGVVESYTYDALNRVLSAVNQSGGSVISSYNNVYDIAGMITQKIFSDGSTSTYSYDALNRLLSETKQANSSIIYSNVYAYDPVGNRLSMTKNTNLGNFWSVDSLNMPPQVLSNMTSAGFGNTASPTQAMRLARSYTYDAANRLTNWNYAANIYSASFPVQTDSYTYDNNGNRLAKQAVLTGQESTPQQTTYSYDFENRLNQLNYLNIPNITGTQTDSLIYNGDGLRVQANINSVTANYLYDGFNILVEKDGSGNTTKTYTRGLDYGGGINSLIDQNTTGTNPAVDYYDYNDLGSVADLTTSTGTTASSYSYDAYGNLLTAPAAGDTNRYLFSTKEFDSRSGLQFFGYRFYDPEIGRWLTPDPLGFVNGPNTYLYVNDNPVNLVDPFGLDESPIMGNPGVLNPDEILNPGTNGNGSGNSNFVMPPLQNPFGSGGNNSGQSDNSNNPQAPTVPMSAPSNDCGGKENAKDCADIFSKDSNGNTVGTGNNTSPWDLNTSTGTPGDNIPPWINPNAKDNVSGPTWKIVLFHIMKLISKHFNPFNLPGF